VLLLQGTDRHLSFIEQLCIIIVFRVEKLKQNVTIVVLFR